MGYADPSPWPKGCQGAISLAFDDGLPSQLEYAVPLLNEYGLQGTFYLNPRGDDWREHLAPWCEVAQAGHELGNHTIQHRCSRAFVGREAIWETVKGLETTSLDELEADILEAEHRLQQLCPKQALRSFAYPCYLAYVGEGATRQSYVPLIARYFPAARGKGEMGNHPALSDLHYLSSWPIAGWMSGEELGQLAETAAEQGRWVILTFHGLQADPGAPLRWQPGSVYHQPDLPVSAFRALCASLSAQRDRLWTAPVITVAQQLAAWRRTIKR